jgi:hypothetical protein
LEKKILSLLAIALNLKENWFDNKINQGNSIFKDDTFIQN